MAGIILAVLNNASVCGPRSEDGLRPYKDVRLMEKLLSPIALAFPLARTFFISAQGFQA